LNSLVLLDEQKRERFPGFTVFHSFSAFSEGLPAVLSGECSHRVSTPQASERIVSSTSHRLADELSQLAKCRTSPLQPAIEVSVKQQFRFGPPIAILIIEIRRWS
jgi:hypothetical protein